VCYIILLGGRLATSACAKAAALEITIRGGIDGNGRIDVYNFNGGPRVVALLHIDATGGVLLVNGRKVTSEGRRVAFGWALAIVEIGDAGWYAMFE
jgi:hypothetical protein